MKFKELQEKAVSKQQQKLMGLALAYKRGEVSGDKVSDTVKDLAKGMSEKELEDFAKTKHKGLPDKVDERYRDKQDASYTDRYATGGKDTADMQKRRKAAIKKAADRFKKTGSYTGKKESVEEAFSGKEVKMAMGIAADPRYKQGNYSDAVRKIERIAKGLSKHPSVAAYLKRMNEAKDPNEYDNEGEMAKTQLKTIIRNAEEMMELLDDEENMPEWVQSKITKASDYMTSAYNYIASEDEEDDEKKVDEVVGAVKRIAQGVRDRFGPKKSPVNDKIKQRDQARKTAMDRIAQRRKEAEKRVRQGYKASQQK